MVWIKANAICAFVFRHSPPRQLGSEPASCEQTITELIINLHKKVDIPFLTVYNISCSLGRVVESVDTMDLKSIAHQKA